MVNLKLISLTILIFMCGCTIKDSHTVPQLNLPSQKQTPEKNSNHIVLKKLMKLLTAEFIEFIMLLISKNYHNTKK